MLETLINIDHGIFQAINGLHNDLLDTIMWWATDKYIWAPLYLALAIFLYRKYGRLGLMMILFAGVLILLSDQSSVLIKDMVQRLRPCHNDTLTFDVHLVNNRCGGLYGFVSSHAANTMALVVYLMLLTKRKFKWLNRSMFFYVMLVSYSRIYMGNHYPADVICGWLVGIVAAFITYYLYRSVTGEKFDVKPEE